MSEVELPTNDLEAVVALNTSIERATHQLNSLVYELDAYAPGLSRRPSVVIANKMDTLILPEHYDVEGALAKLGHCVSHDPTVAAPVFAISALNAAGIRGFVQQLRGILENVGGPVAEVEEVVEVVEVEQV